MVLGYLQKIIYHEDELYITQMDRENTNLANKSTKIDINIAKNINEKSQLEDSIIDLKKGDRVEIEYGGIKNIGEIVSIYNKGETLNIKLYRLTLNSLKKL